MKPEDILYFQAELLKCRLDMEGMIAENQHIGKGLAMLDRRSPIIMKLIDDFIKFIRNI